MRLAFAHDIGSQQGRPTCGGHGKIHGGICFQYRSYTQTFPGARKLRNFPAIDAPPRARAFRFRRCSLSPRKLSRSFPSITQSSIPDLESAGGPALSGATQSLKNLANKSILAFHLFPGITDVDSRYEVPISHRAVGHNEFPCGRSDAAK